MCVCVCVCYGYNDRHIRNEPLGMRLSFRYALQIERFVGLILLQHIIPLGLFSACAHLECVLSLHDSVY